MSFPNEDKFWLDTVQFVNSCLKSGDNLLAPTEFKEKINSDIFDYSSSQADKTDDFQWVIIHKGMFDKINSSVLEKIAQKFLPVFANEVFVVFSNDQSLENISGKSSHLGAFWEKIAYIHEPSTSSNVVNENSKNPPIFKRILKKIRAKFKKLNHSPIVTYQRTNQYGAYLGDYRYLTTTLYGNKIFLDTRDMSLTPHIIIHGMWESWISERVINCLQPGMRAIEVGSNLGWYTLLIANQIGNQGKLIAFEANQDLVKLTSDSISINGYEQRVTLHNVAVSDQNGEAKFYLLERHIGGSSFAKPTSELLENLHDDVKEVTVPTVALDNFLYGDDRKIDFMKIDAEGSEPLVFRGMKQLLMENQKIVIVMEYSSPLMRGIGFDPAQEMLFFFQLGFTAFKIEASGNLTQIDLKILSRIEHCELLLARH